MAQKILGLDLGTNSIGISVRNPEIVGNVNQQLEYFTSIIFPSGVGNGKAGEFSYAAERTKHRSTRRLNQARRYRIWRTLEVLIQYHMCPLSEEDLTKWRTYDKEKGLKREYPIHAHAFEQWVRLDFDMDGVPEYSSPYQLRAELMTRQFDFGNEIERYKLGRAIYHIAQRRGFKSSKGETLQQQENVASGEDVDVSSEMKKSEEKKSKDLTAYMKEHECPTVGCAFYAMEQQGMRVRANEKYQVVRSLYEEEIRSIFTYQEGLQQEEDLLKILLSRKEGEGSIFYKRPLRSQKGKVGACTFEKNKTRCPISRPEFEIFRAWAIINNLRYKTKEDIEEKKANRKIDLLLRQQLYEERFVSLARDSFKMEDILKWLQKKDSSIIALNYEEKTTVMGCPIIYKLKVLLGDNWMTSRLNGKYTYEDLWHVCFTADDNEDIEDFVNAHLGGDQDLLKKMLALNGKIKQDYASLSLSAMNKILYFLQQGYLYNDAVVLAKLPDIFGADWNMVKEPLLHEWEQIRVKQENIRLCYKITNNLIAKDKLNDSEDRLAFHDTTYNLTSEDDKDIQQAIIETLSYKGWKAMPYAERETLQNHVTEAYQNYFRQEQRTYYALENVSQAVETLIRDNFMDYVKDCYRKKILQGGILYHPSMVDIYPNVSYTTYQDGNKMVSKRFVQSSATNVFRNPMVMRVLHTLRKHINQLLKEDIIDENTRIVIETAREFNDANWRWAIKKYQDNREKENKQYREELLQYLPENKITETEIDKMRLWHEQNKLCFYTGQIINISELLTDNKFEIEHTIPRSKSFDDSLANKTICETHYNRYIKKNRCPKDLDEVDYMQILEHLKPWEEKIHSLQKQITERRNKSKMAGTKEQKDKIIRERHVLELELDYWKDKVARFKKAEDELTEGFRHSQLVDTRVITKYAYHLLRATFDQVTVQRGDMTAMFRKALGIQSLEEKKDRNKHSHHAIDATMLTLIPNNNVRDAILELFNKREEAKKHSPEEYDSIDKLYQKRLKACNLLGVSDVPQFIDENILIRHIFKDQALTPASRRLRVRGRIVKKDGKELFQHGNILRGQLHLETWYGAIAEPQRNEQGHLMRDKDGHFLVTDTIRYVVRTPLKYKKSATDSGFKTWEELKELMVDKALYDYIHKEHANQDLQTAIEEGIYDTQGKQIRHIRCYVPIKNPLHIKKQTYLSKKEYKQDYLAAMGDLYCMARYESEGKKPTYRIYSLYDISQNRANGLEDVPQTIDIEGYRLIHTLHAGQQILLYEEHPDEIRGLDNAMLSPYLYVIRGFENPGRITLVHHLSAKKDGELGKGESIKDYTNLPEKIRCGIGTLNYLVEGKDFIITSKGIEFK